MTSSGRNPPLTSSSKLRHWVASDTGCQRLLRGAAMRCVVR